MTFNRIPHFDPFSFPNLTKQIIGVDDVLKKMQEVSESFPKIPTYPPYNIRKVDDTKYVIEVAVAGFGKQDIEVELQEGVLTVKGNITATEDEENFIFKGIADRAFTRTFTLADSVVVKNADLMNGMLKIWLERFIPEEKKPRKIDINATETEKTDSKKSFLAETNGK
jgi:molecular chaperone IbpA